MEIQNAFYRVSAKALILDESKTKFLLVQEDNGRWDIPGGGLDWGENVPDGIRREISEEMGLEVTAVSTDPSYFITAPRDTDGVWTANVFFETKVSNFNFTPSSECVALRFVTKEEAEQLDLYLTIKKFLEFFKPGSVD